MAKAKQEPKCGGVHSNGDGSWWDTCARGIPTARVCVECIEVKRAKYRPEIFEDRNYDTFDERVEADY